MVRCVCITDLPTKQLTTYDSWFGIKSGSEAGFSVSTAGDVNGDGYSDIIVGAPKFSIDISNMNVGEAYVFYGQSGPPATLVPAWTAQGTQAEAQFGFSVSTAGDVNGDGYADIMVGQPYYDDPNQDMGRAYIWYGSSLGLGNNGTENNSDWMGSSGGLNENYGYSVATAGDWNGDGYSDVMVSRPFWTLDMGSVYGYQGIQMNDLGNTPFWSYESDKINANMGYSVASAGDVNGDGYSDFIVGAPGYESGGAEKGAVFVWYGGIGSSFPSWSWPGPHAYSQYGYSVASAGDVNGDGYSDVIIGVPSATNEQDTEGMVHVWYGSSSGLPTLVFNPSWMAESNLAGARFGTSVSSAGDVNGDGYSDIIVGAPNYTNGNTDEGAVFVWYGGPDGLGPSGNPTNADWQYEGNMNNLMLGGSVSSAGDPKKTGYSGVISGATQRAYVWYGSSTGLTSPGYDWVQLGLGNFGGSVSGAGDFNGDGYSDVLVGDSLYTGLYTNEGIAFGYCGSSTGLGLSYCWYDLGGRTGAWLGYSLSGAGDVNGDGFADFLAGAPYWNQGHIDEGQIRLYYGASTGPTSNNGGDWKIESNTEDAWMGYSVSSAGDVNGDGYADILTGLPNYTYVQAYEGKVQLFAGNSIRGKPFLPRQRRFAGGKPITPLGRSDSQVSFNLGMTGFSPFGRSKFKLEWEVKQFPTNFTGTGTEQNTSWIDTGVGGIPVQSTKFGLIMNTPYHWRIRIKYNLVANPLSPPNSRWFHMPWNGWNELDLKTATISQPPIRQIYLPIVKK